MITLQSGVPGGTFLQGLLGTGFHPERIALPFLLEHHWQQKKLAWQRMAHPAEQKQNELPKVVP